VNALDATTFPGLQGLIVLDVSRFVEGAYCARLLADAGASVIKIEPPEGDPTRQLGPFLGGTSDQNNSGLFHYLNTNKRAITLNLQTDEGRQLFGSLLQKADILVSDYAPSDRWSTYAFYSNEFLGGLQIAEQNSTGVVTYDPKNDWIANNTDHVDSIGAGLNYAFVPQKWDGRLWLRYQRANGNAELTTPVTPSNLHPQSIAALDDTKLWTTSAEVQYHVKEHIDLAFGAWIEKYTLNDAESSNLPNYTPGSFFLAPNDLDYRGNVAYIRASYHW